MWDGDDRLHYVDDIEISTRWRGEDRYHEEIAVTLKSSPKLAVSQR